MKNFARSWYIRVRARERQPRLGYQGHAAALYTVRICGGNFQFTRFADFTSASYPVHSTSSVHSSDFLNMNQNHSAQRSSSATGNFYSGSRTPSPLSGSSSRVSSAGRSSSSVRCSESTPLSSRDTTQQLITGLAACQRSIEELLQTVRSSNERIEELADKVKTLDGKLEQFSSDPVDGAESGADGRGKKRKRPKSSLLVQVSG